MKRPGPVTASIVVMAVLCGLGTIFLILMVAMSTGIMMRQGGGRSLPIGSIVITLVPICAGILDLIAIGLRVKWAHPYNIILTAMTTLLFLSMVVAGLFAGRFFANTPTVLGILSSVILAIPTGLLVWLLLALARRQDVSDYLIRELSCLRPRLKTDPWLYVLATANTTFRRSW